MSHLGDFIDLNDTIRHYKSDIYLNKTIRIEDPSRTAWAPPDIKGKTKLLYTVKEGDNLGFISGWYRVGLSEVRYWNNIYRNTIRIGQTLAIYVDPSKAEGCSKINSMTFAEKQAMIGKTTLANTQTTVAVTAPETDGEYITYTVRYGDTIWDIVKLYESATINEILSLNNITDPQKIQVGQKLRIRKKG